MGQKSCSLFVDYIFKCLEVPIVAKAEWPMLYIHIHIHIHIYIYIYESDHFALSMHQAFYFLLHRSLDSGRMGRKLTRNFQT